MRRALLWSVAFAVTGCVDVEELAIDKECPCADGFSCVDGRCDREPGEEARPCDGADAIFCADFEDVSNFEDFARAVGRLETTTLLNVRGRRSLLVELLPASDTILLVSNPFTVPGEELHARIWTRIDATGEIIRMPQLTFVDADANSVAVFGIEDSPDGDHPFTYSSPVEDGAFDSEIGLARGVWHCLQISIVREGGVTRLSTSYDGVPSATLTTDGAAVVPASLVRVEVGLAIWEVGPSRVPTIAHYDELLIDDAPVACN